jgi:hypothetical protein
MPIMGLTMQYIGLQIFKLEIQYHKTISIQITSILDHYHIELQNT